MPRIEEFSEDELAILELVSEDAYAFRELMLIRGRKDAKRAAEVLLTLLERGYVAIEEREDFGLTRALAENEARAAIEDPMNWTDPLDPPAPIVRWHQAFSTPTGQAAYEHARADT